MTPLFSRLNFQQDKFIHQPGSVVASTALIAGTTVGAGILALPAVTRPMGILPSTVLLIAVWVYTLVSGLLVAEVTVNSLRQRGRLSMGLLAMVRDTLGIIGSVIAGAAYLFQHYALLVAYVSQGGEIMLSAIPHWLSVENIYPSWWGGVVFTLVVGSTMYLGGEKFINKLNSFLVVMMITAFLGLLFISTQQINSIHLYSQNWSGLGIAVPVILVALFYHNVVPMVVTQLEGDITKIRQSIIIGSLIPLIMFLTWNIVILSSVSGEMMAISHGFDPVQILRNANAGAWLGILLSIFSEVAIITSFIGFVYGLLDFFQDISPARGKPSSRLTLYSLVLFPPMTLGAINPDIFLTALDVAGSFSISVLGGIIPPLITWKQRQEQDKLNCPHPRIVPGGRVVLVLMMVIASMFILRELLGTNNIL